MLLLKPNIHQHPDTPLFYSTHYFNPSPLPNDATRKTTVMKMLCAASTT